tara:strand:+ start:76 stop:456 length:381 start_codon:yes stop_codon:yes gene_type:complete
MPPYEATEIDGHWVGQEKSRYDFVLKLLEKKSTTRGYWVYRMTDRHGNFFIAFDGRDEWPVERIIPGTDGLSATEHFLETYECFTCKATVNRHDIAEYKYGSPDSKHKQTVLNRIKLGKLIEKTED